MTGQRTKVERNLPERARGFSLLELIVAVAILSVMLVLVSGMVSFFLSISASNRSVTSGEQAARESVGYLTHRLSRATLNNYFDYVNASGQFRSPGNAATFEPDDFRLSSDLHFICGPASDVLGRPSASYPGSAVLFQASFGEMAANSNHLNGLLNACGFFVEFSRDTGRPSFLDGFVPDEPYRYRLVEVVEPAESFSVFASTKPIAEVPGYDRTWVDNLLSSRRVVVADNVILLLVLPKLSEAMEITLTGGSDADYLAPEFLYDSRAWEMGSSNALLSERSFNALPPSLEVVLVTISEQAAQRLDSGSTPPLSDAFAGLFADSSVLHPKVGDEGDLVRFENRLRDRRVDYRVSRFEVPIQAARWTAP